MKKGISIEYALKFLAKTRAKKRFLHKTKYGRTLPENWGYDKEAHALEHKRTKDLPFDPTK